MYNKTAFKEQRKTMFVHSDLYKLHKLLYYAQREHQLSFSVMEYFILQCKLFSDLAILSKHTLPSQILHEMPR